MEDNLDQHNYKEWLIDENVLKDLLLEEFSSPKSNIVLKRIDYDVQSIAGIGRKRALQKLDGSPDGNKTYFFLIENRAIERALKKLHKKSSKQDVVSLDKEYLEAIHLDTVLFKIWQSSGKNDLNRRILRAQCFATINMTPKQARKFDDSLRKIDRYASDSQIFESVVNDPDQVEQIVEKYPDNIWQGLKDFAAKQQEEREKISTEQKKRIDTEDKLTRENEELIRENERMREEAEKRRIEEEEKRRIAEETNKLKRQWHHRIYLIYLWLFKRKNPDEYWEEKAREKLGLKDINL